MTNRRTLAVATALALFVSSAQALAADPPETKRAWVWGVGTVAFSPNWSLTAITGARYELARSPGESKDFYFAEFLAGPNYTVRSGRWTARFSVWYYYQGYPVKSTSKSPSDYFTAQHLDFIPQIDFAATQNLTLTFRTIINNKFYAGFYDKSSDRWGYGMVMRNMLQAKYAVIPDKLTPLVAIEPFTGLVEDKDTKSSPVGYWARGLDCMRYYVGAEWKPAPQVSLTPQYVYERSYDTDHNVTGINHNLYLIASYTHKTF